MRPSERKVRVKVCGITRVRDAEDALLAGVDALGLNFWPGTPRRVEREVAAEIARLAEGRARVVAVFVDAPAETIRETLKVTTIRWAQLHGVEPMEQLRELLPCAYKALRARSAASEDRALRAEVRAWPGSEILVDAYVPGVPGGTGARWDWGLARELAKERPLWLAGGLRPENVAEAVRTARPFGVDVASGVERAPGIKDPARLRAFVEAAKGA